MKRCSLLASSMYVRVSVDDGMENICKFLTLLHEVAEVLISTTKRYGTNF